MWLWGNEIDDSNYLYRIQEIVTTARYGPVSARQDLELLVLQFNTYAVPFLPDTTYRRISAALIMAETTLNRRINN